MRKVLKTVKAVRFWKLLVCRWNNCLSIPRMPCPEELTGTDTLCEAAIISFLQPRPLVLKDAESLAGTEWREDCLIPGAQLESLALSCLPDYLL